MKVTFYNKLIADLKIIAGSSVMLYTAFTPFILLIIFRILLPVAKLHTLVSITLVSSIPLIFGALLGNIHSAENISASNWITERKLTFLRLTEAALISFILTSGTILIFNPVPAEGWLRTLYISGLLSLQSFQIMLLIITVRMDGGRPAIVYFINFLLLISVPAGLLLESPWNIFFFLSPQYWIAWSWVTADLTESIISGVISIVLISVPFLVWVRKINKGK